MDSLLKPAWHFILYPIIIFLRFWIYLIFIKTYLISNLLASKNYVPIFWYLKSWHFSEFQSHQPTRYHISIRPIFEFELVSQFHWMCQQNVCLHLFDWSGQYYQFLNQIILWDFTLEDMSTKRFHCTWTTIILIILEKTIKIKLVQPGI